MRARILLVALAITAVAFASGCANDDPYGLKDLPAPAPETSATAGSGESAGQVGPAAMGQSASAGTWLLLSQEAARAAEVDKLKAAKGKQFIILTLEITNGGALDADISPSFFVLTSEDGASIMPTKIADDTFIHKTVARFIAGERRNVYFAFEVPKDSGPYQLVFTPESDSGSADDAAVMTIE